MLADVMTKRKLFPFFDNAYQGFNSGDINADAYSIRLFVSMGFNMIIA
jgi:aspartate aminotransferase